MPLTYSNYLKVSELLDLQEPKSSPVEHDEVLFIIIHQVYELWFKQVLHETDLLKSSFRKSDTAQVLFTLNRILTIFKTLVSQVDILETMTPLSFNSFRDRLESSSGFQSWQFREFEFVLGVKRPEFLKFHTDPDVIRRLEQRLAEPSVYDDFFQYLHLNGCDIPETVLSRDVRLPTRETPESHPALVHLYRTNPVLAQVCERMVDLDEGIQEWRYRHVKMVERTIGRKMGTGGSAGTEYLQKTLFSPVFPDLWTIRSQF